MDDTMSSYSFSHQFYQRWTCAPDPIRTSIIQELTDITTLLKAETPFETFVFSTHDLDAHLDDLYENHEAEQAIAKAITDKQAAEQVIAEQQRLEEEQKTQAAEDTKRKEEAKLREAAFKEENELKEAAKKHEADKNAQTETEKNILLAAIKPETVVTDKINTDNSVHAIINDDFDTEKNAVGSKTISEHANAIDDESINNNKTIKNDSSINAINNKASAAISLAVKDAKLSVTHKELIHELEVQIDDYLSDQMMLMSENLKSWLRAEMTQHLSEQDKPASNGNLPKN
ncbi:hypothetical protein Psyc_1973 [Psychrobacter arcticus 273-4]|uniref:Uncharacterized protein n=2 Tax=Psychrobacter arcticus TaxID=334543 RepID=Q4FQ88_PSYA2|nr:cell envelope integrity protein TolA [Psychrobacter arcticus]AAZ19820.1 hypothetical protein Psyc_1973 [Psychrobacter arcticus 273-4]